MLQSDHPRAAQGVLVGEAMPGLWAEVVPLGCRGRGPGEVFPSLAQWCWMVSERSGDPIAANVRPRADLTFGCDVSSY